ncbi:MAG TPA: prepilin-type N-terminal cleavage/methylation domain-containing protein [Gallionella sp.]|nr:prepilin-type N-terminal cleavage/methylation domain-containing protein [Gallionella sp.]
MFKSAPRVSSSSSLPTRRYAAISGLTLVELLVALAVLSILAAAALPSVEMVVMRTKEIELHGALREMRTAIDNFHEDWVNGKISKTNSNTSEDGYPRTLQVLVEGVETSNVKGGVRRYLRRIPRDPFAEPGQAPEESWVVRGYQDGLDATIWGGKDIYDVRSASDRVALDGTKYSSW